MLDEMTAIEVNMTWKLVEAPLGDHLIGLKWVFKTKKDAAGVITKYKVRLVVSYPSSKNRTEASICVPRTLKPHI
jgi:hypothetical protein